MFGSRWSSGRVVAALFCDARGFRDRAWIALYFGARLRFRDWQPLRRMSPPARFLSWRSSPHALFVSVVSGGLSSWYETSILQTYAPTPEFDPTPGWTVVDVGANIGAFSVWAAGRLGSIGRIIAIEPNPISYEHLTRSLRDLPVSVSRHQVACSESAGDQTLYFEPGYTVSSSLYNFDAASERVSVPVMRLDDLLADIGVGKIDLLKIDVEGAEELVLRGAGAILARTDRVVLETTAGKVGDSVRSMLADKGLKVAVVQANYWATPGLELIAFQRDHAAAA